MKRRHLRFLTLNLWREEGHSADRLSYITRKLDSAMPDVVALQEVRDVAGGGAANQAEILARDQRWPFVYATPPDPPAGGDGLAILSRFPIGAHEWKVLPGAAEGDARIVLSARIDSELGAIWVHNTQLVEGEEDGNRREEQVVAVDEVVKAHANGDPQIVLGDFNAVPSSDEIRWMCGLTTLAGRRVHYQDAWDTLHTDSAEMPGWTWARANPGTELKYWLRPDRRIDYGFVTPVQKDRRGTIHSARLLFDEPEVRSSGERLFASDHYGLIVEVQMAPNAEIEPDTR
jgi:endonuclease/exonuclease/phosphatase family metal-dependent hydrolase